MVRCKTIGQIEICKNNPILKSEDDVKNYSFLTFDGDLYLIANTLTGDDSYKEDVVIKAGDFLNGFMVEAWKGQNLIVEAKHIATAMSSITEGTTLLVANSAGKLESGSKPASGCYFKAVKKLDDALEVKVMVA